MLRAIFSLHSVPGRLIQKSWTSRSWALASETSFSSAPEVASPVGPACPGAASPQAQNPGVDLGVPTALDDLGRERVPVVLEALMASASQCTLPMTLSTPDVPQNLSVMSTMESRRFLHSASRSAWLARQP